MISDRRGLFIARGLRSTWQQRNTPGVTVTDLAHDGNVVRRVDKAPLRRVSRLGSNGCFTTFGCDGHERLTGDHYQPPADDDG